MRGYRAVSNVISLACQLDGVYAAAGQFRLSFLLACACWWTQWEWARRKRPRVLLQINIVGPFFFFLYIATALHPGGGGRRLLSSVKRKRATSHFLFRPSRELLLLLPDSTRVYRFIFNELCLVLLIVWLCCCCCCRVFCPQQCPPQLIPQFETRALNATAAWDSRRRRRGAIIKRRRPIKFFQTMM